jgi:hypothetical protein
MKVYRSGDVNQRKPMLKPLGAPVSRNAPAEQVPTPEHAVSSQSPAQGSENVISVQKHSDPPDANPRIPSISIPQPIIDRATSAIQRATSVFARDITVPVWGIAIGSVLIIAAAMIVILTAPEPKPPAANDVIAGSTASAVESVEVEVLEEAPTEMPAVWSEPPRITMSQRMRDQLAQGHDPSADDVHYAAEEVERLQAELEAIQRNSAMLRSLTRQQSGDLSAAYSSLEATQEQKDGALEDLQDRLSELEGQIRLVDELARDLRRVLGLPEPAAGMGGPIGNNGLSDDEMDPWLRLRADIVAVEQRANELVFDLDEVNTEIQLRVARVQQTGLPRGASVYDDLAFYDAMPVGRPIEGPITSRFGLRSSPFAGEGGAAEMHTGIDMAAPTGTPVRATGGGTVQLSGNYGGYGLLVIIDHGRGVTTWYGHNSRLLVQPGQHISAGHVIAEVGSTGRSTGPHVHYEVRVNGVPRDPLPLMMMSR